MNLLRRWFGFLWSREWWIWTGVFIVILMIWLWGPLVAIGDVQPLASRRARLIAIALILLWWIWRIVRHRRVSDGRESTLARLRRRWATRHDAGVDEPDREQVNALRVRFAEALHRLRQAKVPHGRVAAWFDRLAGRYRYRLPWYLMVGSGDAGKTGALTHAELDLSIADQRARVTSRTIAPTTQCEWWFSSAAVIVDTPGALLETPDPDTRRVAEWNELLRLLRRHRARKPLDGVILTVAIDTLLALDEPGRAAYAARLRKPLQQLQTRLGVRVPIYLCITKMDRLVGFADYFSALDRDDRGQPWGTTFSSTDAAPGTAGWRAASGFDALLQRLHDGLPDVLLDDPDPDGRSHAFRFPQQFARLGNVLDPFCAALFLHSPFETDLRLRGLYFTSALQEPPRIDEPAAPIQRALRSGSGMLSRPTRRASHGLFLRRLLHDVIFADSALPGANRDGSRQRLAASWVSVALAAALLMTLLIAWTTSYRHNRAYLAEVDGHVTALAHAADHALPLAPGAIAPLSPLLDALRALPGSTSFDPNAPPFLRYRMGLYQGTPVREAADAVYRRALDEKLLPQAASRLEAMLAAAPADDAEYAYNALKAYLMLHDPSHYDGSFVAAWLILDTEASLAGDVTQDERKRLDAHLSRLFEGRVVRSPYALNTELVAEVRQRLARTSLAQRVYHLLRRKLLDAAGSNAVSVVSAGGPQATLVFTRKSGRPLTDGVPALYTYRGYWNVFDRQVADATLEVERDDPWVLGIEPNLPRDEQSRGRWVDEVRRAYLNDYIAVWDGYLNDLGVVKATSLPQSIQVARVLSAPDSPLRQFLQTAARETTLLRTADAERSPVSRFEQRISDAKESLTAILGDSGRPGSVRAEALGPGIEARPEAIVDDHFEPLRRLVGATAGNDTTTNATLDGNLHSIDELYSYLTSAAAALSAGTTPPATDVFNKLQADAGRMPMPVSRIFAELGQGAASLVGGATRQNVVQDARGGVGTACRQMIAGRYPFARTSSRDVAPEDFSRMFGAGGLMDSFFQKNLAAQTDFSGSRWRARSGIDGGAPFDSRLLASFQDASAIRDTFFGASATSPSLQFEVTPLDLDPAITQYQLDVDGQTLRYAHGPQIPVSLRWPGPRGSNLVTLQVSTAGGSNNLEAQGPWAMHRLFDRAQITPGGAPESFIATFDVNGQKLALRVTSRSSRDPFHLPQMTAFACPT